MRRNWALQGQENRPDFEGGFPDGMDLNENQMAQGGPDRAEKLSGGRAFLPFKRFSVQQWREFTKCSKFLQNQDIFKLYYIHVITKELTKSRITKLFHFFLFHMPAKAGKLPLLRKAARWLPFFDFPAHAGSADEEKYYREIWIHGMIRMAQK